MQGIRFLLLCLAACAVFFSDLAALAQVGAPGQAEPPRQQPVWMEVFGKVYGPQGQGDAPGGLGALDGEVEKSWAAALSAGPRHPYFEAAALQTSQYYASQGYDRKSESVLRQAVAAARQAQAEAADSAVGRDTSRDTARALLFALAQRLNAEQKFPAAAALIEEILEETKGAADGSRRDARILALSQLAQLREQMGEVEGVEALLREAKALQSLSSSTAASPASEGLAGSSQSRRTVYPAGMGFALSSSAGFYNGRSPNAGDLAGFYLRQGDTAKAEAVFQKDLENAKAPEEVIRARQGYAYFLSSQQRWGESVAQWGKLMEMQSASSRLEDRQMLRFTRVSLAQTLMAAGEADKALEILRNHVAQSSGDAHQNVEALRSYAQMLIQSKKFDEAEKVVEQIRQPTGKNAGDVFKHADTMADHLLAEIRQMQNRGEEARALREKSSALSRGAEGVHTSPSSVAPLWTAVQPVHELMRRHKYDEALAQLQRILADGAPRIHANPEESGAVANFISNFPPGRQEDRIQLARAIASALDGVRPADHPRVAQALISLVGAGMDGGLSAGETTRLLERQEKIFIASKGEDSVVLNDVSRQRVRLLSSRGDYAEAAAEMRRALKRTAERSGAKSQRACEIMRELAASLQMLEESWPEEESVRLALVAASGQFQGEPWNAMHDMHLLAGRYFAVGQRENAIAWMDRAIEAARKNPHGASMLQMLEQQRKHFVASPAQAPQAGGPFFRGPSGGPSRNGWFDSSEYSTIQGARLQGGPAPASVIRSTPTAGPQQTPPPR